MRLRNRNTVLAVALVLAALMVATTAIEASASSRSGWRSTRYGRRGAEISVEYPRVVFPAGAGYRMEYDAAQGSGFGFGLMWGISDNIAFEGRMLQTNHVVGADEEERQWDIDLLSVGVRYSFFEEYRLQPFAGVGWAKLTMERDAGSASPDPFERLTGYGGYVTIGIDYIHSSAWSAFLRGDYTHGGYGHYTLGLEEEALEDPLSGNCASVSLGVAYRIPVW